MNPKHFTEQNRNILLDILRGMTCQDIGERYGIKKANVRRCAFRGARGLYEWAHFADRVDLLCNDKLNPWGTLSEYRIHYRGWLVLYRAWQEAQKSEACSDG